MTETLADTHDVVSVHNTVIRGFTDRYIHEAGLAKIAHSAEYDPEDPVCDYDRTWWPAEPKPYGVPVAVGVLYKTVHVSPASLNNTFIKGFYKKADEIGEALRAHPVMTIDGHNPDLQAGLSSFALSSALARSHRRYGVVPDLAGMFKNAHVIATRGIAPLKIDLPPAMRDKPFVEIGQLALNPHFSFAINQKFFEAGFPKEFTRDYNSRFQADCVAAARGDIGFRHPSGLRTHWSMAAGGDKDQSMVYGPDGKLVPIKKKELLNYDRADVYRITHRVVPATTELVRAMGCAILPVYTSFGRGKRPDSMQLGDLILPGDLNDRTLPNVMADLALYRRRHGEPNVYYAEEVNVS